jgi:hypothetical protein
LAGTSPAMTEKSNAIQRICDRDPAQLNSLQ